LGAGDFNQWRGGAGRTRVKIAAVSNGANPKGFGNPLGFDLQQAFTKFFDPAGFPSALLFLIIIIKKKKLQA
jgi:hypothetical protein